MLELQREVTTTLWLCHHYYQNPHICLSDMCLSTISLGYHSQLSSHISLPIIYHFHSQLLLWKNIRSVQSVCWCNTKNSLQLSKWKKYKLLYIFIQNKRIYLCEIKNHRLETSHTFIWTNCDMYTATIYTVQNVFVLK